MVSVSASPAALTISSWNINSVRLRIDLVARHVGEAKPDVLCLQEIKCRDGEFPTAAFVAMGLPHLHVRGQKGWHGVAIASRHPLEPIPEPLFCRHGEARVAAVRVAGIEVHNLYVPAGGDEPDVAINPKFDHKLDFLTRMEEGYAARAGKGPLVVTGDLNVAPGEHDVWSHKALLKVVSHTPEETTRLDRIRDRGGFVDLARVGRSAEEKLYSWWSYRSPDWTKNERGRRLDHIWASAALAARLKPNSFAIHRAARAWERPSDHVPVQATFAL
jgi:exodeoxyribonuclease-3